MRQVTIGLWRWFQWRGKLPAWICSESPTSACLTSWRAPGLCRYCRRPYVVFCAPSLIRPSLTLLGTLRWMPTITNHSFTRTLLRLPSTLEKGPLPPSKTLYQCLQDVMRRRLQIVCVIRQLVDFPRCWHRTTCSTMRLRGNKSVLQVELSEVDAGRSARALMSQ